MAKSRKFTITINGTIPKGMTLAQARRAYWNDGWDGHGPGYNTVTVDVSDFYEDNRERSMKLRLGRAAMAES